MLDNKNQNKKYFYQKNSIFFYIFIGVIFCIIGWGYETILGFFQENHYLSKQGLLYGPFVPVYGVGALIYTIILPHIKKTKNLFIVSSLLGGIVEFCYSLLQEIIFGTVSWDYSEYFLNFQGRTSIVHAIFWGILGVVYVRYIYPILLKWYQKIPFKIGVPMIWGIIIFMFFNIYLTILSSYRQKVRLEEVQARNELDYFLDTHYPDEKLNELYSNRIRKKEN